MFSYESIFFFIWIAKKELDTTLFFVANSPNQSEELKKLSNEKKHQWKTAFKGYSKKTWKKHWYLLASLKLNQSFQLKLYLANTLAKNSPDNLFNPKEIAFVWSKWVYRINRGWIEWIVKYHIPSQIWTKLLLF